jgi:hypothetical protein
LSKGPHPEKAAIKAAFYASHSLPTARLLFASSPARPAASPSEGAGTPQMWGWCCVLAAASTSSQLKLIKF